MHTTSSEQEQMPFGRLAAERYLNAQAYIAELHRRINSQHRYIEELQKAK